MGRAGVDLIVKWIEGLAVGLRRRNDGVVGVQLGQPQLHPQMHGGRLDGILTAMYILRFGISSIDNA